MLMEPSWLIYCALKEEQKTLVLKKRCTTNYATISASLVSTRRAKHKEEKKGLISFFLIPLYLFTTLKEFTDIQEKNKWYTLRDYGCRLPHTHSPCPAS